MTLNGHFSISKCPKILFTKSSDKMAYANSVDLDQTAPGQDLHCLPFQQVLEERTA